MADSNLPFTFKTSDSTDSTVKVVVMSLQGDAVTVTVNGVDYPVTMIARGQDGEGGAIDSGDVPGLEVAMYSAFQVVTGLVKGAGYPVSVTQNGVTLEGFTYTNRYQSDSWRGWIVSCDGPASSNGVPDHEDRYSIGMYKIIKEDTQAHAKDSPCVFMCHVDDHGYVDGGTTDDRDGGTGRFCITPENQNSEYAYLTSYAAFLGLLEDITASGSLLSSPGFRQARFINENRHWCWHNIPMYCQVGDHEYGGDQGGRVKRVGMYINARNAWDHSLGMASPPLLDPTPVGDYEGEGTGWVTTIGSVQFISPDREYLSSGPEAVPVASIVTGATTIVNTTEPHHFHNPGMTAELSSVVGSPDINGRYVIASIPSTTQLELQLASSGSYTGVVWTVGGIALREGIPGGGSGFVGNGATENYLGTAQIDLILTAVESDNSPFRMMCSGMEMFYQAPIAVMDAASVAKDDDPVNNLGGDRYGSQQPLGGLNPREMKRLMTQDDSSGNAAQGITGKGLRKLFRTTIAVGDHHHPGCKVFYKPPPDSTSEWFRGIQLWTGSVNQSTQAQKMHIDCLTKWKSHEGTTMHWMPPVDTHTLGEDLAFGHLSDEATKPISALRFIVTADQSIKYTIFNERGEALFETTVTDDNIPADMDFFKGRVAVGEDSIQGAIEEEVPPD